MIRARAIAFGAIVLAIGTGAFFVAKREGGAPTADAVRRNPSMSDSTAADSVWYHSSDVALLATTGRPQLVEFFHPD